MLESGVLIGVDGPLRCGHWQDELIRQLQTTLSIAYGEDKVVVLDPNTFCLSSANSRLNQDLIKANRSDLAAASTEQARLESVNMVYAISVYRALEAGRVVILNSTEIETLAISMMMNSQSAEYRTKKRILSNELTENLYPEVRLVIEASSDYLICNTIWSDAIIGESKSEKADFISSARTAFYRASMFTRKMKGLESRHWLKIGAGLGPNQIVDFVEGAVLPIL